MADLQGAEFEGGKVKVRRLVLDLVLVLALLLAHVLEVEDGPPLGVVEAGRPVEHPEEEEGRGGGGDHLQSVAPTHRSVGDKSYIREAKSWKEVVGGRRRGEMDKLI